MVLISTIEEVTMATQVKNLAGGDTGSGNGGNIVVSTGGRGSAAIFKRTLAQGIQPDYLIAKFDLKYTDTTNPIDGADLEDRLDDPRYYQGDLIT